MAVCLRIKDVALLLYIIGISQADRDLLDNIHLNAENPAEVNDFLHSVLQHRNDFRWIRRYAQHSEPADFRKSTYVPPVPEFFKRGAPLEGLRPVNDVQPYVYENSQDVASDFRSRKFSRRRGRTQRKAKKRRGLASQRHRRSKGSLSLDLTNSENDNGEVKIVHRSQAGVLNVPGQKYFGRHRKSANCDEPDHNQHEVIYKNKTRGANDTKEGNEYYYTSPHDLLGLSQDIVIESENKNKSCTTSTKKKSNYRKVRNSTNIQAVPVMLPAPKPINQAAAPLRMVTPSSIVGMSYTAPTQRLTMFRPGTLTPLENPYPMLTARAPSTSTSNQIRRVISNGNPGNTDFIKLVNYIESPSKDAPFTKQELLGKDADDLLENIDHVLKADRSGLHMYKGMNMVQQPVTNKKENTFMTQSSSELPVFKTLEGHPMLHNLLAARRILPVRIASAQKRIRSISEKDLRNLNEEDDDETLPDVELKFNSHPVAKVKAKKPSNRRRINIGRKKKKKIDKQRFYPSSADMTTPTTTMRIPSSGVMFTLTPNDNNVVNDPNIKLLENADDDNNKNLKLTLKEYLNRENAYNMEKQQEEEEDENAFNTDYNNIQQKKVELEDLTEPTSAAEQRELGRKDEPATPSIGETIENENQFIVIPLKKDVNSPLDPSAVYTKTEYDNIRSADGGFKVKEAEDVIHLGKHPGRLVLDKSDEPATPEKEPLKKRNLLQKPHASGVTKPSILNLEDEDYSYDGSLKDYKMKPEKQDYNYYENFEQKREVSQSDAPIFKGRKLQTSEELGSIIKGSDDYLLPNGGDNMVSSLTRDLIKRSEDDEPDEEPGNDAKEPHYKHKKVQENEPLDLSPKIEETETLHMDVIDPKRRSFVASSMDKVKLIGNKKEDKKELLKESTTKEAKRNKFDFKKKKHHHRHHKEKNDRSADEEREEDDDDEDEDDEVDEDDLDETSSMNPCKNAIHRDTENEAKKIRLHKSRPIDLDVPRFNENLRIGKAKHERLDAVSEDNECSTNVDNTDTDPPCGEDPDTTSSTEDTTCEEEDATPTAAAMKAGGEVQYDTGSNSDTTTCFLISAKPFDGDLSTMFGQSEDTDSTCTDSTQDTTDTTCTDTTKGDDDSDSADKSSDSSDKSSDSSDKSSGSSDNSSDSSDKSSDSSDKSSDSNTAAAVKTNDVNTYDASTDNNDEKQLICCYINKNKLKDKKVLQKKNEKSDEAIRVVVMKRGKDSMDNTGEENDADVMQEDKELDEIKGNIDKDDKIDNDDLELDSDQEVEKHTKKHKENENDEFNDSEKEGESDDGGGIDDQEMAKASNQKSEVDEEFEEEPEIVYKNDQKGKKFSKAQYTNKLEKEKEEKYIKSHPGEEEKMKELQDYEEQAANSGMKGGASDLTEKEIETFTDTTDKQVRCGDDLDDASEDLDDKGSFENYEIKAYKLRSPESKKSSSKKVASSSSSTASLTGSTAQDADDNVDNSDGKSTGVSSKSTTEDVDFDATIDEDLAKKSTTEVLTKAATTSNEDDVNSSNSEQRSTQENDYTEASTCSDTDKGLTFLNITISMVSGKSDGTTETSDASNDDNIGPSEEDLKELTKNIVKLVKNGKFCNKGEDKGSTAESEDDENIGSTDSNESSESAADMPTEEDENSEGSSTSSISSSDLDSTTCPSTSTIDTSTCTAEPLTGDSVSSTKKTSTTEECSPSTLYESSHKLPDSPTFAPIKDQPMEDSEMITEPKKADDAKNKPILIKSSTIVQINNKPEATEMTSTMDADDVIPEHINEGDIRDIISSQYPKLPVALVPKRSHFVEELAEEEIQENDKRNVIGKRPEQAKQNQEALVENLQKLINRYKNRLKGNSLQSRDIYNMVHHHSEKKKQKSVPKDPCITEPGSYYDKGTSDPVKREATNAADDDDDELDFYHEKHIFRNRLTPLSRPIKEAFVDAESLDDALKEKMIFQKVYDSVVRSKKKVHNPEVYKIIDEYFDNTQPQADDEQPVCPVDDNNLENIEIPVKRKQEYEELQKEKQEDEDATEDTGGGLVDVIRARKKTMENFARQKKNQKTSPAADFITSEQTVEEVHETTKATEQTDPATNEPKIKLDNVDSFKDVVEHPIGMFIKRRSPGSRQLQNLNEMSETYLSPVDEEQGDENRRLRRKLRYLRHQPRQAPAPDRVIPFNYNDYIQNHRQGRHFGQERDAETNFHEVPNSNNPSTESETTSARMKGLSVRADSPSTTTNCDTLGNGTKGPLSEEEQRKKERDDMRNMLNGDLPMNLINVFYNKLRDNNALYNRFGGSISSSKECSFENVMNIKTFREEQAKVDIKHAEEMLHEVIVMLNRIVADQVHRKTCLKLSPNLKLYVIRITRGMRNFKKNNQIAEGYPLPKIKYRSNDDIMTAPPEQDEQGQLLFDDETHTESLNAQAAQDRSAVRKRIKLIEKLLEKYQRMSMRCQVQVEPVRNYLMDHLQLLMRSLEKSEERPSTTCAPIGFHGPKEPQISDEDIEPPKGVVQLNAPEDAKADCTTIQQRSIQAGNEPDSEISHRQQVLMETQMDQKKLDEVNQFMAEQQDQANNTPDPHGYKQDQQRGIDHQDANEYKDYRRTEDDLPQKENRQAAPPSGSALPSALPRVQQSQPAPQIGSQSQPQPSFVSTMIGVLNPSMIGQTITEAFPLLDKTKYTNPDLVSKDLFALGLGGINTYLPPFSVTDMVKDIKTTNRVSGGVSTMPAGEGTSYGNTKVPSLPPPSGSTGVPSQPKPRSGLENFMVTQGVHHPISLPIQTSRVTRSGRYKRVSGEEDEDDSSGDAASKIRQLALNPYQQPLREIIPPNSFRSEPRSTFQEYPFKAPQEPMREMALPKVGDVEPPKLMEYEDMSMLPRPKAVPEMMDPTIEQQMQQMAVMQGPQSSDMAKTPMRMHPAPPMEEASNYAMPSYPSQDPHVKPYSSSYRGLEKNANAPKTKKAYMRKAGTKKSEWSGTAKYKKLMEAYESMREKRQNEERLAKLFGSKDDDKMALKTETKQIHDISKVNFEKPLVFSLDA